MPTTPRVTLRIAVAVLTGWGGSLATACRKPAPQAPPPPEVAVLQIVPRTVEEVFEFVGNVEASKSVEVRAQVGGVIVARPFAEGQAVRIGQELYRIDPTSYDADWRAARARLAEAEARQANMEQNLARMSALLRDNAISRQEYDNAVAQAKQAQSGVEAARGVVDRAKKNLDDTAVRAELSGRVGRAQLEVGARIRGSEDVLTTIDVLDPIYVSFRPAGQQLLAWRRDPRTSKLIQPGGGLKVQVVLPDGSTAPLSGRISFVDPVLDPATGTQQFRAELPNPDKLLLPGQFVRVRLLGLTRDSAIVVPQRAVLQQLGRQSVFVVAAGDTIRVHDVTATAWIGSDWVIERGLSPGDRIVVDGVQKVRPGIKVRPVPLADSTRTAAAPAGGSRP